MFKPTYLKTAVIFIGILTFFAPVLRPFAFAQTQLTADRILSELEKKYTGKSFTADYFQISTLDALDIVEKASGIASFSYPGKMRWEYKEPENHQVITNGETLWIFRPSEKQVMVGRADEFFKSGAGGAFLSDISLIKKNYDLIVLNETVSHVDIKLTAKHENSQITSIIIRMSRETWLIERVKTYNPYNDTTLFEFYNTRFMAIDPQFFEFKIPESINVLEME